MSDEYVLSTTEEKLSIACADVDRLLELGSGDTALLYLMILRRGGYDPQAAAALKLNTPLNTCLDSLVKLGLLRRQTPAKPETRAMPETELPQYAMEDVVRRTQEDPQVAALMKEISSRLGRMLSGVEMTKYFSFYDYLGLSPAVILVMLNWCIEEQQRKYHDGRMPTLKQIEREAYIWNRQGISSLDEAENYIRAHRDKLGAMNRIRALLGIADRPPSKTEENYLLSWSELGFDEEAFGYAYDKTVLKKGSMAWPYMNSILTSWHKKGLHTLQEIRDGDRPDNGRQEPAARQVQKAPDAGELRRMQQYMKELNGGSENGT